MTIADIIILIVVILILGLIIFFSIFKKRKNRCAGCPYARACGNQKSGDVNFKNNKEGLNNKRQKNI